MTSIVPQYILKQSVYMNVLLCIVVSISSLVMHTHIDAMDTAHKKNHHISLTFAPHYTNKTIIRKITHALTEPSLRSRQSIAQLLQQHYMPERLNSLLGVANNTVDDRDYWHKRRSLNVILVCAGANPNFLRKYDQMSLLGQAVLYDDIAATLFLLQHHANPNVSLTRKIFKAPLIWYAHSMTMAHVLINYGALMPTIASDTRLSDCDQTHYNALQALFSNHAQ